MKQDRFIDPILHLVLLVTGVAFLAGSFFLLFAPLPLLRWFMYVMSHGGRFPDLWASSSLLFYMLRATAVLYVWLGLSFLLAAEDPARYSGWVLMSGIVLLFMALVCAASGRLYHLPRFIYLGDAGSAAIGGLLIIRFARRRRYSFDPGDDHEQ